MQRGNKLYAQRNAITLLMESIKRLYDKIKRTSTNKSQKVQIDTDIRVFAD
ncbi:MAG: hypothetical protein WCL18_00270 [bacterium]